VFTGMLLINIYYWGMEQYIVQEALASKSLVAAQKGMSLAAVGKLMAPLLLNVPGLIAVQVYPHLANTATVFPTLVSDILPPVIAGFIAAIVFGGALSTFNAGINSLGTMFVVNLRASSLAQNARWQDDARLVKMGRRFQWIVIILAVCFSPYILFYSGGFYNYIQKVSSFFSVPVFTVMIVGLVTRRVPAIAAKTGLVFFAGAYILSQFVLHTGLHYLHVLGILFVLTVGLMLIIGKLHPLEQPFTMPDMALVNIQPWKNRYWYFGVLVLLMVAVFVLFSPLGLAS
jgi:SSS family solute:Na+ symporter